MSSTMHAALFHPHPDDRSGAARAVGARVCRKSDGAQSSTPTLEVEFAIEGDVARIRVPQARVPRFAEGLWKHTCCECFIGLKNRPSYHEFNFSPSGEWAVYAFSKYREGRRLVDEALNPSIACQVLADRIDVKASIPLYRLSAAHVGSPLSIALSAVIEDAEGVLSYWALRHPPGKPDFHHHDGFVLDVAVTD